MSSHPDLRHFGTLAQSNAIYLSQRRMQYSLSTASSELESQQSAKAYFKRTSTTSVYSKGVI